MVIPMAATAISSSPSVISAAGVMSRVSASYSPRHSWPS